MIYVYNVNNRTLTDIVSKEEIDLTKKESKFIEVICNGSVNTWDEMNNYVNGYKKDYESDYGYDAINTIRYRVCKKVKLNIKTIKTIGYRLLDLIYIDRKEI